MSNNKIDVSCFQIMEILCRKNVIYSVPISRLHRLHLYCIRANNMYILYNIISFMQYASLLKNVILYIRIYKINIVGIREFWRQNT